MHAVAKFHPRFDRAFYLGVSALFLVSILWVFARTYYLKLLFETPPLTLLVHVHGAVMSGWVVLLAIQTGLVTTHHVRWHRKLGVFGAIWAGLVVILGSTTTVHAAIHYRRRLDYHKRLMLLTIGCMLPSAISRLPMVEVTNLMILTGFNGFVVACVAIDTLRHRRVHPAFPRDRTVQRRAARGHNSSERTDSIA